MGQCAGGSRKLPSAVQLCQAYEQQSSKALQGDSPSSIWHHLDSGEVGAIGEIVSNWARGLINGQAVRWQLQCRVLGRHSAPDVGPLLSMIDSVFLSRSFEEARVLTLRELGLEGARALPAEVRAGFHDRAGAILQSPPLQRQHQGQRQLQDQQQHMPAVPWLDLVRLCTCVEVVRHLQASHTGKPAGIPPCDVNSEQTNHVLLHEHVALLLEEFLEGASDECGQSKGLTAEEMDRHCPKGYRSAADREHCPICMEQSAPGVVRTLPCSHVLHQECCEAWFAKADTCPLCRFQIK